MFLIRYRLALALGLTCAGLAAGQEASTPPASKYQDRVGKTITVQEASRPAERCHIGQAWELADGNVAMQVRSLGSGQTLTVVEQVRARSGDRYLVYRWTVDGLPPGGCPMPAGAQSIEITKGYPHEATKLTPTKPLVVYQPPVVQQTPPVVHQPPVVQQVPPVIRQQPPVVQQQPRPVVQAPITIPTPPVATKPPVMPESPRPAMQGPVITTKPQPTTPIVPERGVVQAPILAPKPEVSAPIVEKKPAPAFEAPRVIVENKVNDLKLAPVTAKPQASGPIMPASAPATTNSSAIVQAKPITSELPRVIVQPQPEVIKPSPTLVTPAQPIVTAPGSVVVMDAQGCVGHMVMVTEKGKAPDQCVVLEMVCHPDGSTMMRVQSLCTGEVSTIVCGESRHPFKSFFDRFRFAKRKGCDVCCEPCAPGTPTPSAPAPKVAVKYFIKPSDKTGDPLLNMDQFVGKKPEPKKEEPKVAEKPKSIEKPTELPKVAEKPIEKPTDEPKLPAVNPKDVATKPAPPPVGTKFADARPIEKPVEKGVMVPVPLVPLSTTEAAPNVPPPQPVVRPFETRESKAVATFEAEPKHPIAPPSAQAMGMKTPAVIQAANKPSQPSSGYLPRGPECDKNGSPVGTTGWAAGPYRPANEVPTAIQGVQRASYEQDPTTTQNTVYLLTVLQTSGTPSQREWAAQKLCTCDPRTTPYVVEALTTAGKTDTAALVRIACIQTLVKLQAKNPPVIGLLQQAKFDKDPRVADEAMVALTVLSDVKPEVKQVDAKVKK